MLAAALLVANEENRPAPVQERRDPDARLGAHGYLPRGAEAAGPALAVLKPVRLRTTRSAAARPRRAGRCASRLDDERLLEVGVVQDHPDLAPVALVDQTRRVHLAEPVPRSQPRARHDEPRMARRQSDRDPGAERRHALRVSNRFAHAAAVAVAEAPGKAYNPLLDLRRLRPGQDPPAARDRPLRPQPLHRRPGALRQLSEEFTNEFINAIRDDRQDRFKRRYRDVDVLLIDDIQFLEGKIQTQEEFFHTFNTLHNANKQIVLTSDRRAQAARGARGPAAQPVRVGPDHRRPAARPRDPDRDPAQEGRHRAADRAAGRAGVHRLQDPDQHPRARGRADPGHRVRQPQPPGGRPDPGRDRAQGPDPRGRRARDHRGADHRPDRGVLRAVRSTTCAARAAAGVLVTARQIAMYLCRELTDLSLPKIGAAVRRPRPHHGDARRPQDPPAARRAPQRLQPGHRAHQPDQACRPASREPDVRDRPAGPGDGLWTTVSIRRCTACGQPVDVRRGRRPAHHGRDQVDRGRRPQAAVRRTNRRLTCGNGSCPQFPPHLLHTTGPLHGSDLREHLRRAPTWGQPATRTAPAIHGRTTSS